MPGRDCGSTLGRACGGTLGRGAGEPPKLVLEPGATDKLRMGAATWVTLARGEGSAVPSSQVLRLGE